MEFPFTYAIDVDGWTAGAVEGVLVLEPDPVCNPAEPEPTWTVAEVQIDVGRVAGPAGSRVLERTRVELPDTHWLHDRLWTAVIDTHRHAIDDAWARHIRAKLEAARRGFRVHADPSV